MPHYRTKYLHCVFRSVHLLFHFAAQQWDAAEYYAPGEGQSTEYWWSSRLGQEGPAAAAAEKFWHWGEIRRTVLCLYENVIILSLGTTVLHTFEQSVLEFSFFTVKLKMEQEKQNYCFRFKALSTNYGVHDSCFCKITMQFSKMTSTVVPANYSNCLITTQTV